MENIVISRKDFRALASETRAQIIKLLQERKHTLSELSKKLNLSNPTVKQHLDILQQATLVELEDEGRKWKYYALTRKGKNILLEQPQKPFVILLAITTIAMIALLFSIVTPAQNTINEKSMEISSPAMQAGQQEAETAEPQAGNNNLLVVLLVIVSLAEGYLISKTFR